ncbi:MAG: hypothetical protein M1818_000684 [Claussenomyces sp. TS43310]|nr:MAG: hypothetical protein M1818_000684 [Claussenomyces sp. TS43310]
MATMQTVVLAKRPGWGPIIAGETLAVKAAPMPKEEELTDGQVIVKNLYLSLDPAMRGWLNDVRSYTAPLAVGEVMRGVMIGVVTASKSKSFPTGTHVEAQIGWREYGVVSDTTPGFARVDVPDGARLTDVLGVLGMTGLTAYFGMTEIAAVKPGDFVVVSGAAGATGSVAGQIAKLKGARVLGLAGSDDKVKWLKELGFDDALNYKDKDFVAKFKAATPNLIDVFFDNVGGETLELAISRANSFSRFVMCGAISQYNTDKPVGPKNITMLIAMRIKMQGFIVLDYASQFTAARTQLATWLRDGSLQRRETIIRGAGLAAGPQALIDLYQGVNTGKLLLEVAPEDVRVKETKI